MKRYTPSNLVDVEPGWYWAKRFAGDTPKAVPVYWRDWTPHQLGRRLVIDFGYRSEVNFYPERPDLSDHLDDNFVLLGPIPVPEELTP